MSADSQTPPPEIEPSAPKGRYQYKLKTLLLLPVLLAGALLWLDRKELLPTRAWSAKKTLTVDFEMTRGATGRPLEGVQIEFFTPSGKLRASGVTGPDGRASIVQEVTVSGRASIFRKVGANVCEPLDFQVSFEGRSWPKSPFGYYAWPGIPDRRPLIRWGL